LKRPEEPRQDAGAVAQVALDVEHVIPASLPLALMQGMICMSPRAPMKLVTWGRPFDSTMITATTVAGSRPRSYEFSTSGHATRRASSAFIPRD
jgi:hypothetical protein